MYSIHQVVNNQPTQCGYYIFEVLDQPVRNEGVRGRWKKKWDGTSQNLKNMFLKEFYLALSLLVLLSIL